MGVLWSGPSFPEPGPEAPPSLSSIHTSWHTIMIGGILSLILPTPWLKSSQGPQQAHLPDCPPPPSGPLPSLTESQAPNLAPKLAAAPRIWTRRPRVGDGIPKNRGQICGLYRIGGIYPSLGNSIYHPIPTPEQDQGGRSSERTPKDLSIGQKTRSKQDSGHWQVSDERI